MSAISFTYQRPDPRSAARIGRLETPHGVIETPAFVVGGARAAIGSLQPHEVAALGASAILCNAYHLYLQPGADLVAEHGGLHEFMGWTGPIIMDAGSAQVFGFPLAPERSGSRTARMLAETEVRERRRPQDGAGSQARHTRVDDDGVTFRSQRDGSTHRLSPEQAIRLQETLGGDIMVALDEPTWPHQDEARVRRALERNHRWAGRALGAKRRADQGIYGVVQGGRFPSLREQSAVLVGGLRFDGYVVGGTLGVPKRVLDRVLAWSIPPLPEARPRHVTCIGEPDEIFRCVERGIDTFDCVAPTYHARHGVLMTADGPLTITRAIYREDDGPIDPECACPTCKTFSRAYVRHLFKSEELLAATLATTHNLAFVLGLVARIRAAIADGTLASLKREVLGRYAGRAAVRAQVRSGS